MENVQLIQQTAVEAAGANKLTGTERAVILPEGHSVKDLESFMTQRIRYRGKLQTTSLADFVGYVKRNAQTSADAFVDIESMSAKAFFNLGNLTSPGHGDYTATLELPKTAAFAALCAADGKKASQKVLAEWLEDWNEFIVPEYADDNVPLSRAIAAVRNISIKANAAMTSSAQDLSSSRSTLEAIDAQSSNDLPNGFNFVCEPYLGLMSRKFRLGISIITGDKEPALVLRWQQREATVEKIAQEFKSVLADQLGATALLTIGKFTP